MKYWLTTPCYVMRNIRNGPKQENRVAHIHIVAPILILRVVTGLQTGTPRIITCATGSSVRKRNGKLAEHTIGVRWKTQGK